MNHFARLRRDRAGTTALEFAIVASVFLPLSLGILDTGLLMWTKGALQATAALTARCAALSSPDCIDARQFAVTTAGKWIFPGIVTSAGVTPAPAIVCVSNAQLMRVTITTAYWAGAVLPPPLNGKTLTAVAYFPVAGAAC